MRGLEAGTFSGEETNRPETHRALCSAPLRVKALRSQARPEFEARCCRWFCAGRWLWPALTAYLLCTEGFACISFTPLHGPCGSRAGRELGAGPSRLTTQRNSRSGATFVHWETETMINCPAGLF